MRLQTAEMPGIGLKVAGKPANSRLNPRINSNWPHQHVPKWLNVKTRLVMNSFYEQIWLFRLPFLERLDG